MALGGETGFESRMREEMHDVPKTEQRPNERSLVNCQQALARFLKSQMSLLGGSRTLLLICVMTGVVTFACVGKQRTATTLASGQGIPNAIVVDDTYVYWTSLGQESSDGTWDTSVIAGSVMRMNKDGSNLVTLASELYPPLAIAADRKNVYWIAIDGIQRVSKSGGSVNALVTWDPLLFAETPNSQLDVDIAVDETSVYWTTCHENVVMKMDKDGENQTALSTGHSCPIHIALDDEYLYWTDMEDGGSVMRVHKDGGEPVQLAIVQGASIDIAVDGSDAYWTNVYPDQVMKVPIDGGEPLVFASRQFRPSHIVVDEANVYWASNDAIKGMRKSDGRPMKLVGEVYSPAGIITDAETVYFANTAERAVVAVSR